MKILEEKIKTSVTFKSHVKISKEMIKTMATKLHNELKPVFEMLIKDFGRFMGMCASICSMPNLVAQVAFCYFNLTGFLQIPTMVMQFLNSIHFLEF